MPKPVNEPRTPRDCAALMLSHVCESYRRELAGGHGAAASLEKARGLLTEMLRQAHEDPDRLPDGAYAHTGAPTPSRPMRVGDAAVGNLGGLMEVMKLSVLLAQELRHCIWHAEACGATRALRQQMGMLLMRSASPEIDRARKAERRVISGLLAVAGGT